MLYLIRPSTIRLAVAVAAVAGAAALQCRPCPRCNPQLVLVRLRCLY